MGSDFAGLNSEPYSSSPSQPQLSRIAGRWRRLFAFVLDSLLLGVIGAVLGAVLYETFVQMGQWARLVGLVISLLYFSFSESAIGGGRSLGKRLLGLKVMNAQGAMLRFEESGLRFLLFGIPFFANGLSLPLKSGAVLFATIIGLVVFGLGGANLYLMLFNGQAHQGLHDIVARSYVVDARPDGVVIPRDVWKGHWVILGTFGVLLCTFPVFVMPKILNKGSFPEMMQVLKDVQKIQGVQTANVREVTLFTTGRQSSDRVFSIDVTWNGPEGDEVSLADEIAKEVLLDDKEIANYSKLRIAITRGYDLGIGSRWSSRAFAYSPGEWRQRVQ